MDSKDNFRTISILIKLIGSERGQPAVTVDWEKNRNWERCSTQMASDKVRMIAIPGAISNRFNSKLIRQKSTCADLRAKIPRAKSIPSLQTLFFDAKQRGEFRENRHLVDDT